MLKQELVLWRKQGSIYGSTGVADFSNGISGISFGSLRCQRVRDFCSTVLEYDTVHRQIGGIVDDRINHSLSRVFSRKLVTLEPADKRNSIRRIETMTTILVRYSTYDFRSPTQIGSVVTNRRSDDKVRNGERM